MIKGLIRVAARAVVIQLEESAARSNRRWPQNHPEKRQVWQFEGREGMRMAPKVIIVDSPSAAEQGSEVGLTEPKEQAKPADKLEAPEKKGQAESASPRTLVDEVENNDAKEDSVSSTGPPATSRVTLEYDNSAQKSTLLTAAKSSPPPTSPITEIPADIADPTLSSDFQAGEAEFLEDEDTSPQVILRPSKVPSSRLGRLFHYTSLAAGLSMGAASEVARRSLGGGGEGGVMMSEANVRRLVDKLGRMRGAALKLGQFMSIQDTNMLPKQLEEILQQVQGSANYMPEWQMENVMREELGPEWESNFSSFTKTPFSAASIGQVHHATLSPTSPLLPSLSPYPADMPLAVKIQFPGIKDSISSDLNNLSLLLRTSALLPRGLFLDKTIAVFREELAEECDYVREGESGERFRALLGALGEKGAFYEVPRVVKGLGRERVLVVEMMGGQPLSRTRHLDQATRDKIGTAILRLCLLELFEFRFMQTDPNWANFLYDNKRDKLQLIDFGASRQYSKEFMDDWFRLLKAGVEGDNESMEKWSLQLGYLTGEEKPEMLSAHLESIRLLAVPFNSPGVYDFAHQTVTDEVKKHIPVMLKNRLTPPPRETYSLNRKLSGAFLLCARLRARISCSDLWEEVVRKYRVAS